LLIAFSSELVSSIEAAATFSAACSGDPDPGIGSTRGDLASSQASAICRALTRWLFAAARTGGMLAPDHRGSVQGAGDLLPPGI
jgi:hypothetical protein